MPNPSLPDSRDRSMDSRMPAAISALLDEADDAELLLHAPLLEPSTSSSAFAELLNDLIAHIDPDEPAFAPAQAIPVEMRPAEVGPSEVLPVPLRAPGDLVLVIGLDQDPVAVARSMVATFGETELRVGGAVRVDTVGRVEDRRSAIQARADGVRSERSMIVAWGLASGARVLDGRAIDGRAIDDRAEQLVGIGADQVWIAVDATRKHEDTVRWVRSLGSILRLDAVAAHGLEATASPETVSRLGLPVGWVDGHCVRIG